MSGLARIVLGVLALYGAWVALIFFGQRAVLYPGATQRVAPAHPPRVAGLESIAVRTAAGPVDAWLLPAAASAQRPTPALIFLHGNAELIDDLPGQVTGLTARGISVLLVEYPGFGRSAGRPSQASITEAVVAAYDSLVAREEVDPERVIAYGRSLGGAAAAQLAARRPVAALVTVSAFTSVRDYARGYLVPPGIVRDPFDTREILRDFAGPVLIVHGRRDTTIPYWHAEELARIAPQARLVAYDCAHNDCPPDFEAHWDDVAALVEPRR